MTRVDRHLDDGGLNLGGRAVLQDRLAAADLLQRQLAAFVIHLLEPVEAVAAVAEHLAGLADPRLRGGRLLPSCFASSSSPTLARMIFCSLVMDGLRIPAGGRGAVPARGKDHAPPTGSSLRKPTLFVRLNTS